MTAVCPNDSEGDFARRELYRRSLHFVYVGQWGENDVSLKGECEISRVFLSVYRR